MDSSEIDPSRNILILYNSSSADSVSLKDYYLQHRPGFSTANVLAINNVPATEIVDLDVFYNFILGPFLAWISTHSEKQIKYVVLMYGMPSRTQYGIYGSVQWKLSRETSLSMPDDQNNAPIRSGKEYFAGDYHYYPKYLVNDHFSSQNYPGTAALFTHMNMGSVDATKNYIDKIATMYSQMVNPSILISAQNAGKGGETYYFDNYTYLHASPVYSHIVPPRDARDAVLLENPNASINYTEQNGAQPIYATDVAGLCSFGKTYGGVGAIQGKFSGKSSWWIIESVESFNGQQITEQDNFVNWFSSTAWGSSHYENTPVGAVTHVEEPLASGVNAASYFRLWERGYSLAEAAWASRRTPFFMVVGDPLVKK